jgi:hypothetical protein
MVFVVVVYALMLAAVVIVVVVFLVPSIFHRFGRVISNLLLWLRINGGSYLVACFVESRIVNTCCCKVSLFFVCPSSSWSSFCFETTCHFILSVHGKELKCSL